MHNISLKKQLIILITLFITIYAVIGFFTYTYYIDKKEHYIESKVKSVQEHYNVTYQTFKTNSTYFYKSIINNKKIMAILKDANSNIKSKKDKARKKLNKIFDSKYQLVSKLGIDAIQFHLPNNESFFRRGISKEFGDNLTFSRYSIKQTNKFKKPYEGFEGGIHRNAFRFVFPIFDETKKHIGSMEGSVTSSTFIQHMERALRHHLHFVLRKDAIDLNNKKLLINYLETNGLKNCLRLKQIAKTDFKHTKNEKKQIKEKLKNFDITTKKPFVITAFKHGKEEIVIYVPILNIQKNKTIAYFVSYDDNNNLEAIKDDYIKQAIIGLLISFLLTFLIFKIIKSKENLQIEVYHKTKELEEFNKNLQIKIDDEVSKNEEKTKQLYITLKNAQMGEMIGNIAHQWRQPLSIISTSISGLKAKKECFIEDENDFDSTHDTIMKSVGYLSETIDTFRDFIKEKQELKTVILQDRIDSALSIVSPSLKSSYIKLINEIDYNKNIMITMVVGELSQVIINILNNAKDIMVEKNIEDRWIKIQVENLDNKVLISIEDNGGGIAQNVLPKIFEPYFTTKHQSQGTGLGLHMSYEIITKHLLGKLYVKNTQNGAKFFIELPLS